MSSAQALRVTPQQVQPQAASERVTLTSAELSGHFKSGSYRIEQPYIQILKEGYTIVSADGSEVYTAERPRHWLRSMGASILGIGAAIFAFLFLITVPAALLKGIDTKSSMFMVAMAIIGISSVLGAIAAYIVVKRLIAPLRRAEVKDKLGRVIMLIEPTKRFFIVNNEFAIKDARGVTLATFSRDFIECIFQTYWHCRNPQGRYIFSAKEDSLLMSLLRRYCNLARFIPMHFNMHKGHGKRFGKFSRNFSLRDKYKLEFNPAIADGWLMVATAILLDTGEAR